ncbi:uncharacterized protein BDW70DRAFT_137546 [Aspergillus foveolatus]|uniref:uncharacterized protein n=1 Tax=Aspergillus foveolatus TaxID=210207 RepID=UPI003CCDC6CA
MNSSGISIKSQAQFVLWSVAWQLLNFVLKRQNRTRSRSSVVNNGVEVKTSEVDYKRPKKAS